MSAFHLAPGAALLVASRGTGPEHGLTRWVEWMDAGPARCLPR
jgi:hypothetical protein